MILEIKAVIGLKSRLLNFYPLLKKKVLREKKHFCTNMGRNHRK